MKEVKLRVFKIPTDNYLIINIPALNKVYKADFKVAKEIPKFITVQSLTDNKNKRNDNLSHCTFLVTNKCNLQCAYCYGDYGVPASTKVLSFRIAKAVIDYIVSHSESESIGVHFFGGEPTLAWDLIVKLVDYTRNLASLNNKKVILGITTNGYCDANQSQWLANLDNILLSFDGPKIIQDAQRSQSFDKVFETARLIYSLAPHKLSFRSTISDKSVNYLPQIVEFFSKNFPGCIQHYEPLFEMGRGQDNSLLHSPDPDLFFEKFIEAFAIASQYNSKIQTSVLRLKPYSESFCGAAGRNFVVTWNGEITSCVRMSSGLNEAEPFFHYGYVDGEGRVIIDNNKKKKLELLNSKNIQECQNCYAEFSCKGDCPANKAVIDPLNFWRNKSWRCKSIRKFIKRILELIVEKQYEGLF